MAKLKRVGPGGKTRYRMGILEPPINPVKPIKPAPRHPPLWKGKPIPPPPLKRVKPPKEVEPLTIMKIRPPKGKEPMKIKPPPRRSSMLR